MKIQLVEIIRNQEEGLFPALRSFSFGQRKLLFHVAPGFGEGVSEHGHILVGSFYAVERCLLCIAQSNAFRVGPIGQRLMES